MSGMMSLVFFLHVPSLAFYIVFVLLPSANGVDDGYSTCSSLFTCGSLRNIGYPFWGEGRPQYCGHSELQLQCLEDVQGYFSYLKFGPDAMSPFLVLNITFFDHHNFTMTLLVPPEIPCNLSRKDFGGTFQQSENVENFSIIYKCNKRVEPNYSVASFSCYDENQTKIPGYYVPNVTANEKYSSCKILEIPVLKKEMYLYNKGNIDLFDVIEKGFEVNYGYSSECIKCNSSGCICGSSTSSEFACFCKPGHKKSKRRIIVGPASLAVGICTFSFRHGKSNLPLELNLRKKTEKPS